MEIIAHRGASRSAPENTLPAFRLAWKQGADVSRLAGQAVRLRFVMKDADLFSLHFQ